MKRLITLLALLLMGQNCESPPPEPPPDRSPYCYGDPTVWKQVTDGVAAGYAALFGGEESVDRRATLRMAMDSGRCTGVAIDAGHAVTAGHCVWGSSKVNAALGGYGEPPYWDQTAVAVHPDYKKYRQQGNVGGDRRADLAVIDYGASRDGEYEGLPPEYAPKIFDPENPEHASRCLRFRAQGWGRWEESRLSLRECEYRIDRLTEGELFTDHGPDECRICFGDSGGPLYAEMDNGELWLAGITRITGSQDCDRYSGHVRMSKFENWIAGELAEP